MIQVSGLGGQAGMAGVYPRTPPRQRRERHYGGQRANKYCMTALPP